MVFARIESVHTSSSFWSTGEQYLGGEILYSSSSYGWEDITKKAFICCFPVKWKMIEIEHNDPPENSLSENRHSNTHDL